MRAGLEVKLIAVAIAIAHALGCLACGSRTPLFVEGTLQDAGADGEAGPCPPTTCAAVGAVCGTIPDGCGGILRCGSCVEMLCGGGGANRCGFYDCAPKTCADLGATCGIVSDGCTQAIDCGRCAPGEK
jgi:hypothetical protein